MNTVTAAAAQQPTTSVLRGPAMRRAPSTTSGAGVLQEPGGRTGPTSFPAPPANLAAPPSCVDPTHCLPSHSRVRSPQAGEPAAPSSINAAPCRGARTARLLPTADVRQSARRRALQAPSPRCPHRLSAGLVAAHGARKSDARRHSAERSTSRIQLGGDPWRGQGVRCRYLARTRAVVR